MSSRYEKRWVWIFAVAMVVITSIPYIIGFGLQGEGWRFTGFIFGVEDGNSYIAKMLSGWSGEWLFKTPYTAYPQNGILAFLPYILLGKLAAQPGLHDQLIALFNIFRLAAILLLALAAYDFTGIFLSEIRHRRLALILIFLGGGVGFLSIFGIKGSGWYGGLPLEFYSPESFGFLAIFALPHIAAGRAFLLLALAVMLKNDPTKSFWRKGIIASGLLTLLGLMQPLTVVIAWAILGSGLTAEWLRSFFLHRKQVGIDSNDLKSKTKLAAVIVLFSVPIPLYTFLASKLDPFLANWTKQNLILSPPPGDYLLAYGLILPFVVAGAILAIRKKISNGAFLVGWMILFPFLAYAPYPLQRRLPEGIWICVVVLAILAVSLSSKHSFWARLQPVMYIGMLSTLLFYAGALKTVQSVQSPLYVSKSEVDAFNYLGQVTHDVFPVVLADYDTSNAVPAWAPVRTIIGHGPESIDLNIFKPQVESFLKGTLSVDEALKLVENQGVAYILVGPKDANDLFDLYPFIEQQYCNSKYAVYKVASVP